MNTFQKALTETVDKMNEEKIQKERLEKQKENETWFKKENAKRAQRLRNGITI